MPFGIKLNNSGNKRVIGSDTTVPRFVGKYTRTTWSIDDRTGKHLAFTVNCPELPLCFINVPTGKAASVGKISGSAGSWVVTILVPFQVINPNQVTLYAFSGGYTTESSGGYGIKIKKSSGEVAFDTGYKHLMLRKALYSKDRGSINLVDWPGEGITKPAIMCNTWGSGFYNSGYIATDYIVYFGGLTPTQATVFFSHWKDHIFMFSDGFGIISFSTLDNYPGWSGTCGVDWDFYRNSSIISCSATKQLGDQYLLRTSTYLANKNLTAYAWGGNAGDKSHLDSCVGDPLGGVGYPFNPVGIAYGAYPPVAGAYDVFVINGADYD